MTPAIKLEGVGKRFGSGRSEVRALRDVSFELEAGRMLAVAGPSGSGKTTLLNLVGALEAPSEGSLRVGGVELDGCSEAQLSRFRRAKIGYVFQQFNLFDELTVGENIELPLILNRVARADRTARIAELLDRLGLPDRSAAFPVELSSGEQQRVALARAVAHGPELILADEPTANLDSANAREVVELLNELRQRDGMTVLLASHDQLVLEMIDAKILLRDGAIERIDGLGA